MLSAKTRKYLAFLYAVFLLSFVVFVNNVLDQKAVKILEEPIPEQIVEIKPVKVTLYIVNDGNNVNYETNLTNSDTVIDLLIDARKAGILHYEITEYTDKNEVKLLSIKNIPLSTDKQLGWKILTSIEGDKDANMTTEGNILSNIKLIDNERYILTNDL